MENDTEKQAGGRWIIPKGKEKLYSMTMLRYFVDEAEIRVQDTVHGLATIRDRYYTLINILLVAIGAISTVLFTCPTLTAANRMFLTVLLVYVCIVGAAAFFRLQHYNQYGPGSLPKNMVAGDLEYWMTYYHDDSSEVSCLCSILEYKQEIIDMNQKEIDRQLKFLRIITVAIGVALAAVAVTLVISFI